ncbi:MAG: DNA-directed RNA polymerase subunit alpha [Candidatus Kerfeldbacteria bacterium]
MSIPLPNKIDVEEKADNHAVITVSPCFPGYGTTVGNALRRVLLSSLPGAAITAVKIKGVDHEFSTLENVKEDIVEVILNLKTIRVKSESDDPIELELSVKGEKVVTAADFKDNAQVEIMTKDIEIATLTDKAAELNMKVIVEKGSGYVPVEERNTENLEVGYIAIDSVYTPIRNVNYNTEHVRVGQMTNYDKLLLDVVTDGTINPEEAFRTAAKILVEQFQSLTGETGVEEEPVMEAIQASLLGEDVSSGDDEEKEEETETVDEETEEDKEEEKKED